MQHKKDTKSNEVKRPFFKGKMKNTTTTTTNNNHIYNKILDCDWFSARLFVM